jgi:molybdopterin/thiamine biosynthesis adenylyltransferase/rhodanese-related sulfurtransferase
MNLDNRYSRQTLLTELGNEGQEVLKNSTVLVIGAGGLGCPVIQYLAAGGVGKIIVVDGDKVSASNLHRQVIYSESDIGLFKVDVTSEYVKSTNGEVRLDVERDYFNKDNAIKLAGRADVVVDCSDNFGTRYLVNDVCIELNKPLVYGSIHQFQGQLSVFNYNEGPQLRDLFPETPSNDEAATCEEEGVLGPLAGIVGSYMALETIKVLCGIGKTLSGRLLSFDGLSFNSSTLEFKKWNTQKVDFTKENYDVPCKTALARGISKEELEALLAAKKVQLVDVRDDYEIEEKEEDTAYIPFGNLYDREGPFEFDNKEVVFYCQNGARSKVAANWYASKYNIEAAYVE